MAGRPEENRDSNSAGMGYISLDQAWALALQYAQDHREFYGNISEQELTWDALSAHETEQDFEVRLSFRSGGSFRTAGVEQINIGKTGSIESRQIVNQPRLSRGFIAVAVAIAMVAVAGVVFGGLFAAGRPDAINVSQRLSTSVSISHEAPARLISPDGEVSIDLNANTVGAPAQLAYSALSISEIPALPPGFTSIGKAFELTTKTPLLKPITVTVALSDADVALAEGQEENIAIHHYTGGAWTQLDTAVDFRASTATAQVDSLSMFALTVRDPDGTPIQVPGAAQAALPADPGNPTLSLVRSSPVADSPTAAPEPSPTAAISRPAANPVPVPTAQPVLLPILRHLLPQHRCPPRNGCWITCWWRAAKSPFKSEYLVHPGSISPWTATPPTRQSSTVRSGLTSLETYRRAAIWLGFSRWEYQVKKTSEV